MDGFSQFLTNLNRISNIRARKVYKKRIDPFTKYTDSEFRSKYRFSKINMRYIINLVKDDLEGCKRGGKIPVDLQVLAAIRYWGRNEIQDDCADIHGFSQQTLSRVCRNVAIAFARKAPEFIKMPASLEEQAAVITGFHAISGFNGVVGAIDCTHIRIQKVGGEIGPLYINRKGYYSLNVQVVCDAKLKIRDIVAHWRGSAHDSRIFRESSIRQRFENNEFRGRLVGDGGYACTPYLFVPLRNPTNPSEMEYNKAQISTRNTVERCFGVWKQRFRSLLCGMRGSLHTIKTTIVALAVLHCIAIDLKDGHFDISEETQVEEVNNLENDNQIGIISREVFIRQNF